MMNRVAPIQTITISREAGAGGRTCGEQLARRLGWKLWDKELIAGASGLKSTPPEQELGVQDEKGKRPTLWERLRHRPAHRAYLAALKEALDQIADEGRAVILGRGASILLRYRAGAFHLRLVAPLAGRARRLREAGTPRSEGEALDDCRQRDEGRRRFVQYFFGEDVADLLGYHATINTGQLPPAYVAELAASLALGPGNAAGTPPAESRTPPRVITLTSQLGSRETDLARELGRRLNMRVWDRETLARETGLATVSDVDLAAVDSAGVQALRRVMADLGRRGDALVVGRGGSEFLRDCPSALRVKLITPASERVCRVMEYRWIDDAAAGAAIAESDARRKAFYQQHFGVDWDSPLEFDLVVNTAALGPRTADLIIQAANLKWYGVAARTPTGEAAAAP
jgi:cytidylate kinase